MPFLLLQRSARGQGAAMPHVLLPLDAVCCGKRSVTEQGMTIPGSEWGERRSATLGKKGESAVTRRAESVDIKAPELAFLARIDRSRITHSAAFRRLQGKTQVVGVGENDFFRTRLTHSLEVAQIGASLTNRLAWFGQRDGQGELTPWVPPEHLIETACLAHDIGHPAFGHNGEKILNYYMLGYGGFEGNGQTLRLLSRLGEYSDGCGYDFTRRTLLAVLKYPVLFSEVAPDYPLRPESLPRNLTPWHPPKCIHDDEAEIRDWLLAPFSAADRARFCQPVEVEKREAGILIRGLRAAHKSLDCSIMEIADDIAYGVHDLEDALAVGLLSPHKVADELGELLREVARLDNKPSKPREADYFVRRIASGEPRLLKQAITNLVNFLVKQTEPVRLNQFEHPLLDYRLRLRPDAEAILKRLKGYVLDEVIAQPRIRTLEYKGQKIISGLFEAFRDNPQDLLPRAVSARLQQQDDALLHRTVCDYIASMSDGEATAIYQRLFLPGNGSIFEPW